MKTSDMRRFFYVLSFGRLLQLGLSLFAVPLLCGIILVTKVLNLRQHEIIQPSTPTFVFQLIVSCS